MKPRRLVRATTFSISWSRATVNLGGCSPPGRARFADRADLPTRWGGCHLLHQLVASHSQSRWLLPTRPRPLRGQGRPPHTVGRVAPHTVGRVASRTVGRVASHTVGRVALHTVGRVASHTVGRV